MEIEIWAPPTVLTESIAHKLNNWMRLHPSKPPFQRFLQDHISSEWPVFWHLKIAHTLLIYPESRTCIAQECFEQTVDLCCICHSPLSSGTERVACGHTFHTMCLHQWFRLGNDTCPLCRSPCLS